MDALGAEGRRFESCLPDHFSNTYEPATREQVGNERKNATGTGKQSHGILTEGFVYFVRIGDDGPFKVGFATDVRKRVARLQVGSPYPLIVIHQEPGSYADEAKWHHAMRSFRIRGEWFEGNWMLFKHLKAAGVAMRAGDAWKLKKADRHV